MKQINDMKAKTIAQEMCEDVQFQRLKNNYERLSVQYADLTASYQELERKSKKGFRDSYTLSRLRNEGIYEIASSLKHHKEGITKAHLSCALDAYFASRGHNDRLRDQVFSVLSDICIHPSKFNKSLFKTNFLKLWEDESLLFLSSDLIYGTQPLDTPTEFTGKQLTFPDCGRTSYVSYTTVKNTTNQPGHFSVKEGVCKEAQTEPIYIKSCCLPSVHQGCQTEICLGDKSFGTSIIHDTILTDNNELQLYFRKTPSHNGALDYEPIHLNSVYDISIDEHSDDYFPETCNYPKSSHSCENSDFIDYQYEVNHENEKTVKPGINQEVIEQCKPKEIVKISSLHKGADVSLEDHNDDTIVPHFQSQYRKLLNARTNTKGK